MDVAAEFKKILKPGGVYRTSFLLKCLPSERAAVQSLLTSGVIKELQSGLYYCPKLTKFGEVFPKEHLLIKEFLKSPDFLLYSPNLYNSLGLGLTQLYNLQFVLNRKRDGNFKFLGRQFRFFKHRDFPKKITREFLLVDLLNNKKELAVDEADLELVVRKNLSQFDSKKLLSATGKYGLQRTKNFIYEALGVPSRIH